MNAPDASPSPAKRQVVLVTGSGKQRVGWHVAQALAERGAALAIHYHRSAEEAQQTVAEFQERGVECQAFAADLADELAVRGLFDALLARFGRLDAVVHCAAIWQRQRLEEVTAHDVRQHLEINTLAAFLVCQQAGLRMVRQPTGGSIVTVGDWAIIRPYLDYAAYFPSKGAIPALTRSLAVELGTRNPNVRVNCVLPGPVMLPPDLPAAERAAAIRGTLVKREGTPRHVAQAVLHFLDNDFVTGACLPVDGGRSIYAWDERDG